MPIEDLSGLLRMPRLGKIRLGERTAKGDKDPYPKALDYFLVREDDGITSKEAAQAFHDVYGDEPKVLDIMFPSEDPAAIFPQYYTAYGRSTGKQCQGDGVTARRWVGEGKERKLTDMSCPGLGCDWYKAKKCRRLATLQVILPKVPGLGVWHISTTSKNSIINVNSGIALIKKLTGAQVENEQLVGGRIAFIPLKLRLKEIEVQKPDGKLGTVYVLDLANEDIRFMDILQAMNAPPLKALLPDPQDDPQPPDLFPDAVVAEEADPPVQETDQPLTPAEQKEIRKEINQVLVELSIGQDEANQLAKDRFGKIDSLSKLNEFTQVLRDLAAERKTPSNGEPPAPLLSDDEKEKMKQEINRVVAELGLEQHEVIQLVEEFGTIDSYARHDAFLQALRDKAAQKAQGTDPPDFEKQAIQVAEGLDIPEQVVKQIIRDQFDTLDSQSKLDALVRALNELAEEYAVKAGKTAEKALAAAQAEQVAQAPLAGRAEQAGPAPGTPPAETEDPAQVIGLFFAGLNPLIKEAQGKGVKCSLAVVVQQAGYKDADELRKALINRGQVDELFKRVREKLGLTAA